MKRYSKIVESLNTSKPASVNESDNSDTIKAKHGEGTVYSDIVGFEKAIGFISKDEPTKVDDGDMIIYNNNKGAALGIWDNDLMGGIVFEADASNETEEIDDAIDTDSVPTFEEFISNNLQQNLFDTSRGDFEEGAPVEITKGVFKGNTGTINKISIEKDKFNVDIKDKKGIMIGSGWHTQDQLKRITESKRYRKITESVNTIQDLIKWVMGIGQELEWIDNNLMGGEANMSRGFIEDEEGHLVDILTSGKWGADNAALQEIADDIDENGVLYINFDSEAIKNLAKKYRLSDYKKEFNNMDEDAGDNSKVVNAKDLKAGDVIISGEDYGDWTVEEVKLVSGNILVTYTEDVKGQKARSKHVYKAEEDVAIRRYIKEDIELVHAYDDDDLTDMFGTGALTGKKEKQKGIEGEYISFDGGKEKWFPSNRIKLVEGEEVLDDTTKDNLSVGDNVKVIVDGDHKDHVGVITSETDGKYEVIMGEGGDQHDAIFSENELEKVEQSMEANDGENPTEELVISVPPSKISLATTTLNNNGFINHKVDGSNDRIAILKEDEKEIIELFAPLGIKIQYPYEELVKEGKTADVYVKDIKNLMSKSSMDDNDSDFIDILIEFIKKHKSGGSEEFISDLEAMKGVKTLTSTDKSRLGDVINFVGKINENSSTSDDKFIKIWKKASKEQIWKALADAGFKEDVHWSKGNTNPLDFGPESRVKIYNELIKVVNEDHIDDRDGRIQYILSNSETVGKEYEEAELVGMTDEELENIYFSIEQMVKDKALEEPEQVVVSEDRISQINHIVHAQDNPVVGMMEEFPIYDEELASMTNEEVNNLYKKILKVEYPQLNLE